MSFQSVLNSLKFPIARTRARRARRGAPRKRAATCKLLLELLENRTVPSSISLAPSEAAPQLVGERVTWTATATDAGAAPVYQFSSAPHGGAFHVVRDFSPTNSFAWTPMLEGTYDIEVTVKDGYQAAETTSAVVADAVASRVTGPRPSSRPRSTRSSPSTASRHPRPGRCSSSSPG